MDRRLGCVIQHRYIVSSTQTLAHEWAAQGAPEGALVLAEGQSGGRGRSGKSWHSPVGTGIWMSLILRPPIPVRDATHFTLLTSLGVKEGIEYVVDLPIFIKWPNDLLIHGKKFCGILTEIRSSNNRLVYMIIGIGINVNYRDEWPDELQLLATSLANECGKDLSRLQLLSAILQGIENQYDSYLRHGFGMIKKEWEKQSGILGRKITTCTSEGEIVGTAHHLNDRGELVIRTDSGDISIHSPYVHLC